MAYLLKSRHGVWYFRYQVPKSYQAIAGKTEIRQSLGTKSYREANRRLPKVFIEVMESLKLERSSIDTALTEDASIMSKVISPTNKTPLLSIVLNSYIQHQELKGYRSKTIGEKEFTVNLLIRITKDKPIDQYTAEDSRAFRDAVLKLPPRFNRLIDKGLTLKQIINTNKGNTITVTSYNNYIRALSSVFSFAIAEGYIDRNPFKGFKVTQKLKQSSFKDVVSREDAIRLFDYLSSFKDNRPERYWIPLICYFTGARLGEIAQLYKDDVKEVEGIWCIHINDNRDDKRLKNTGSNRVIPISSELINLGLLEYIGSLNTDRLFPLLKYSDRHGYGVQLSIFFTKAVRKLGIEGKVSFHSIRHTFVNILKVEHDISEPIVSYLVGHSSGSTITFQRYGKDYTPKILLPVIELIEL